ncbi:hypothetical protein KFL_001390120 [Klebsormidium nitens]|uniref:CCHC-type domain-containing protein n=1 Tax=Klebsormidium nitens TaxID=105231 RepID=A0A1Y1HX23_KLENI|nr:hypothetical protein KFL_001390120 [Klebsormidium nitens]|eukprot:GAQ83195.1 hypothetical protein KFL_001390120 [Klebsormidium nitens]
MATVDLNDVHNFEVKGSGVSEGHTLLERGTRLINTATKGTRWRDVRSTREAEHTQGIASSRSSALESRAPGTSLDAIFGKSEPGKGRQKLRFTRNPQPDVIAGSIDNEDAEMPVRSSPLSTIARPLPRGQFGKSGGRLRRSPLSGLLAGYETADESEMADTSATLAAGPEWVVEPCPVCHGTATLVCDVCDSGWPPGACPACKGVGYKTCTHCHGSGTTYRQTKRSQPPKTPAPSKVPAQSTSAVNEPLEEEGPSLLEAYRIIKNERRMQSASSGANGRAAANGTPAKTHWLVGRPKSPEHRAKISRAMQGKPRSPLTSSHRKKLSDLRREFFEEPGARERWSELAKKFWAPRKRVMHCSYCGLEGHNSRFCPERGFVKSTNKPCPICGQPGHGRGGSCPKRGMVRIPFRCKKCGEYGHEAGQCPNSAAFPGRTLCEICGLPDHRVRECPERPKELIIQRCSICGQPGHNRKRCPQRTDAG